MHLAKQLGWHFLDSGALYRIVAVAAMEQALAADNYQALGYLAENLDVRFNYSGDLPAIFLSGRNITGELRTERAGAFASKIASVPAVRAALVRNRPPSTLTL